MKNKFFPTFEQDISATVKLCVLTVAFVVLATWAVHAAQKAITKIYRKMEAEDMEFYRRAQESETRQRNRRKYASTEPTLQSVPPKLKQMTVPPVSLCWEILVNVEETLVTSLVVPASS